MGYPAYTRLLHTRSRSPPWVAALQGKHERPFRERDKPFCIAITTLPQSSHSANSFVLHSTPSSSLSALDPSSLLCLVSSLLQDYRSRTRHPPLLPKGSRLGAGAGADRLRSSPVLSPFIPQLCSTCLFSRRRPSSLAPLTGSASAHRSSYVPCLGDQLV